MDAKRHERQFKQWAAAAEKAFRAPFRRRRWSPLPTQGYRVASALARGGAWRVARVPAWCDGCGDPVDRSVIYLDTGLRQPPGMSTYRLCITCAYR